MLCDHAGKFYLSLRPGAGSAVDVDIMRVKIVWQSVSLHSQGDTIVELVGRVLLHLLELRILLGLAEEASKAESLRFYLMISRTLAEMHILGSDFVWELRAVLDDAQCDTHIRNSGALFALGQW